MSTNTSAPLKTEQFDMDTFFDFNQSTTQASPSTTSTSTPRAASLNWNAVSPFDKHEEHRQFSGPSHDYNLYKQQVGLPVGSLANVQPQSMFNGYDSNMGDMEFGWASGIDIDADMSMDFNNPQSSMPPMFFQAPASNASESFVDPNSIGGHEEPTSNVGRLWPGMHSQQAQQMSMQKAAQTQAMQQRQMKLQAQHAQYRTVGNSQQSQQAQTTPQPSQGHAKRLSHASEPHVEESISRLLSQMRNGNSASADDDDDDNEILPHIARMKKDEEDMDEDERLLASEEGKKLSSKERRQLRNKVSARAFRSRRKGMSSHALHTQNILLTLLQNTSVNSKAKSPSKRKKPPTSAQRTLLYYRRTIATGHSSRPCFVTQPSRRSLTTSARTLRC